MTSNDNKGFLKMLQSMLAALFGIQSERKRQEDFQAKSPFDYILFGIIGVILLLVVMAIIVNKVLNTG